MPDRVRESPRRSTAERDAESSRRSTAERDVELMRHALGLAERGRGRTSPNPIVGCVIVDAKGKTIAEGWHKGPGTKHAEVDALAKLGGRVPKGSTMYVNLEPCTHQGRTPPCAPAVIASGVVRVVVGSEDPVPGHGGGMAALRRAGIRVDRALVAESDAANRPFFTWAREQRPAFTLKAAITLDGKIATVKGQSQWITGDDARADGRKLRDTHDAILVGVGTVIADDPELTTRLPGGRDPIRIVLDSKLRIPPGAKLLKRGGPRTIVVTTKAAPNKKLTALAKTGAQIWLVEAAADGRVSLTDLARKLGEADITSVLVEGGGEVHASVLAADLADELVIYVAPKIVGGPAPSWVGGKGLATLAAAYRFQFVEQAVIGEDLRLRAVRIPPAED